MKDIKEFTDKCYLFNKVAGKDNLFDKQSIQEQVNLIKEEVNETQEGLDNNDLMELADGAIDVLVTTLGLIQKLEALGIDMNKAASIIADNNLSKFTKDYRVVESTIKHYMGKSEQVYPVFYNPEKLYAIKRLSDNKVMKPVGFVSADISSCIPVKH